ncbi:hypothetical protein OUZ56_032124 [Daphnia magna]|uniref:Uncharacterized protein n=1 Tax=Daphnia magna TaxID=35525 RepID=A0ABQ9ZW82_9CRUS|nr:hypothetical protein OUZ56_032124 [Daphnia magna]
MNVAYMVDYTTVKQKKVVSVNAKMRALVTIKIRTSVCCMGGLSILDVNNKGRGQQEKKRKKLAMPGESTTDNDSDNEIVSQPATQSAVKANKHSKEQSPKKTSRKPQATSTSI